MLKRQLCYQFRFAFMCWPHRWCIGKESSCQIRWHMRCRFDPCIRKTPWRRKWQPTPVFLPGESHGQRSLADKRSLWGHKESDTTKQMSTHTAQQHSSLPPLEKFFPCLNASCPLMLPPASVLSIFGYHHCLIDFRATFTWVYSSVLVLVNYVTLNNNLTSLWFKLPIGIVVTGPTWQNCGN